MICRAIIFDVITWYSNRVDTWLLDIRADAVQTVPALDPDRASWQEFTNRFVQAIHTGKLSALRKQLRECDALFIDDLHFLAKKPATHTPPKSKAPPPAGKKQSVGVRL